MSNSPSDGSTTAPSADAQDANGDMSESSSADILRCFGDDVDLPNESVCRCGGIAGADDVPESAIRSVEEGAGQIADVAIDAPALASVSGFDVEAGAEV